MGTGIIVCGLNGCGKSTLGYALAEALGFHFIDNEDLFFARTSADDPYANPRSRAEAEELLTHEVKKHKNFVFAAVKGDYGLEITRLYRYAVFIEVPKEVRRERIRTRSFRKFGSRMLPGGDVYEQEERFFEMAAARTDAYVADWLQSLPCPIIQVDGTKPVAENISFIRSRLELMEKTMEHTELGKTVLETDRLILREMVPSDLDALCKILCDAEVMRAAYETPFRPEETQGWLNRHIKRYRELGFGLWAVVLKGTNEMIGQCGLTIQPWRDEKVLEIGYLFQKAHWHKGYATEAAVACKEYAFTVLKAERVCSIIRDTHMASQKVALRNGMRILDSTVKNFRNVDMNFILYGVENPTGHTAK